MRRYLVMALAMAASALPFDVHAGLPGVSAEYGPKCVEECAAPVMVTALPAVAGLARTVTVTPPLVVAHAPAFGPQRQANQSFALPSGTSRVATMMPFVASDVVTVNPFAASVATAVCTTADGVSGEASVVGWGAVTGAGVAQPASSSKAMAYRVMPDDAPAVRRTATPLPHGNAGRVR